MLPRRAYAVKTAAPPSVIAQFMGDTQGQARADAPPGADPEEEEEDEEEEEEEGGEEEEGNEEEEEDASGPRSEYVPPPVPPSRVHVPGCIVVTVAYSPTAARTLVM